MRNSKCVSLRMPQAAVDYVHAVVLVADYGRLLLYLPAACLLPADCPPTALLWLINLGMICRLDTLVTGLLGGSRKVLDLQVA